MWLQLGDTRFTTLHLIPPSTNVTKLPSGLRLQEIQLLIFDLIKNSLPMSFQSENSIASYCVSLKGILVDRGTLITPDAGHVGNGVTALPGLPKSEYLVKV